SSAYLLHDCDLAGQFKEALSCYTRGLHHNPNHLILLSNRAQCYLKLQRPLFAIADAQRALEIDPRHVKSQYRLVQAHADLGEWKTLEQLLPSLPQEEVLQTSSSLKD